MKTSLVATIAAAALLVAGSAGAQQTLAERPPQPVNVPLAFAGGGVLAATYIPSFLVGVGSPNSSDKWLLMPVIGPWIDVAERGCGGADCGADAGNKILLVGDGILQVGGAVALVSSFFVRPNTLGVMGADNKPKKPTLQFSPMQMGRGASVGAGVVGTF